MKKNSILIISLLVTSLYLLSSHPSLVFAQDAPNTNVTKRRPDPTTTYAPSPTATGVGTPSQSDIKQVQTSQSSFLSDLWDRIKAFFAGIFRLPSASTTTVTP